MSAQRPKYTPRGYQTYILEQISSNRQANLLLELDCGLGKRFITHQIVTQSFPELRFIIVVHSSSSLVETLEYLRKEYGALDDELGELSSRVPSKRRLQVIREKRVVVTTPQILARVIELDSSSVESTDAILINEVDTLVRRVGGNVAIVYPWPSLFGALEGKWIVGMSGTLRDDHAVLNEEQLEIRHELSTLRRFIPNAVLVSMEDLYGRTDVEDYLEPTFLRVVKVSDRRIRSIAIVLDELIRNARSEIVSELQEDGNLQMVEGDSRKVHMMIERLPVSEELKARYTGLLMLRKYVYGMPPKAFLRMFHADYVKHFFNVGQLSANLPEVSSKALEVLGIVQCHSKAVILTSYLEMVEQTMKVLEHSGLGVLTLTGQTRQKGDILSSFRNDASKQVLIMSPVGERDLDIPQAEVMVVCDVINTTKTMYQKFKRTRGGEVILLAYEGTSEELKVERLMKSILSRYPWSTAIVSKVTDNDQ